LQGAFPKKSGDALQTRRSMTRSQLIARAWPFAEVEKGVEGAGILYAIDVAGLHREKGGEAIGAIEPPTGPVVRRNVERDVIFGKLEITGVDRFPGSPESREFSEHRRVIDGPQYPELRVKNDDRDALDDLGRLHTAESGYQRE